MATYQITALPSAVAAVQAVPLQWAPYIGADAWGAGSPVHTGSVRGGNYVADPQGRVFWGLTSEQFYDSATDTGYDDGTTWNEARAVSVLQAISGVTVSTV